MQGDVLVVANVGESQGAFDSYERELLWIGRGYRVETWQNDEECLRQQVCSVVCLCIYKSVHEV